MNHKFKVVWPRVARWDLRSIIQYIKRDRPVAAKKIQSKILLKSRELAKYPYRGRSVPELSYITGQQFREIIISPWRVIYCITDSVKILAVVDSRRDVEDLLYERLVRIH